MTLKFDNFFKIIYFLLLIDKIKLEEDEINYFNNLVVVVSLDGFRYDYLDKYCNKNGFLYQLSRKGVRAKWSDPIFPTNTYPNHWSIVTGLYPESSGIINNNIYDPNSGISYHMNLDEENKPGWFQNSEPIWITNDNLNKKHSVVYDWPGSSARYFDSLGSYAFRQASWQLFDSRVFNKTINEFVSKISFEKTNLALVHFGEPDISGHNYGPDSEEVKQAVINLDQNIFHLISKLKEKKFYLDLPDSNKMENIRFVDLIILSDHGMQNIRPESELDTDIISKTHERHVFLSDYRDVHNYINLEISSFGSVSEIWPIKYKNVGFVQEVFSKLNNSSLYKNKKIKSILLKNNIPHKYHLKNNDRTAPIIIIANEGYQVMFDKSVADSYYTEKFKGNHGFDLSDSKAMRGFFIAVGKSFKSSKYSKKSVKIIDYYSLICYLINLNPLPNNGTFYRIRHLLNEKRLNFNLTRLKKMKYFSNFESDIFLHYFYIFFTSLFIYFIFKLRILQKLFVLLNNKIIRF